MKEVRLKAPAKVNLTLDILGKRADGYHEVKMVMQAVTLFDFVTIRSTSTKEILLRSTSPDLPANEENIMWKAVDLVRRKYSINKGVELFLEKRIPIAAGLAGGSTDGAAVLKGLNRLWELHMGREDLMRLAAELGSDVPFCLVGGTALATGRGEIIRPLSVTPDLFIVLVKDNFGVSTREIYERFKFTDHHPDTEKMISALERNDLAGIVTSLEIVLEPVTFALYPRLERIREGLLAEGAAGILMSGSGPTVFGDFETEEGSLKASAELRKVFPGMTVLAARSYSGGTDFA